MNRKRLSRYFILSLLFLDSACAVSITSAVLNNTSPVDFANSPGGYEEQFRSSGTTGVITNSPTTGSFSTSFRWVGGLVVPAGGATVANLLFLYPSYEVNFTISDPSNLGYSLSADSILRGFVSAQWTGGATGASGRVDAGGSALTAYFDSGSGYGAAITSLGVNGNATATAIDSAPFFNVLSAASSSAALGSFSGTRTFGLRFSQNPSPSAIFVMQNDVQGQAAARFGLSSTLTSLNLSAYPGLDAELAAAHGHFLNINATFNSSAEPVPEPATFSLVGLAMAGIAMLRRVLRPKGD